MEVQHMILGRDTCSCLVLICCAEVNTFDGDGGTTTACGLYCQLTDMLGIDIAYIQTAGGSLTGDILAGLVNFDGCNAGCTRYGRGRGIKYITPTLLGLPLIVSTSKLRSSGESGILHPYIIVGCGIKILSRCILEFTCPLCKSLRRAYSETGKFGYCMHTDCSHHSYYESESFLHNNT